MVPTGALLPVPGGLLGTAVVGGEMNAGTIFKLAAAPLTPSTLSLRKDGPNVEIQLNGNGGSIYRIEKGYVQPGTNVWITVTNSVLPENSPVFMRDRIDGGAARLFRARVVP
jgi:hypothetical protein